MLKFGFTLLLFLALWSNSATAQTEQAYIFAINNVDLASQYSSVELGTFLAANSDGIYSDGGNPYVSLAQQWIVRSANASEPYLQNGAEVYLELVQMNSTNATYLVYDGAVTLASYPYPWLLNLVGNATDNIWTISDAIDQSSGNALTSNGLHGAVILQPLDSSQASFQWEFVAFDEPSAIAQLTAAAVESLNGNTEFAIVYSSRLCALPGTATITNMIQLSCQQANNFMLGYSVSGAATSYVQAADWTVYESLEQDMIGIVAYYEQWIANYQTQTVQEKLATAQTALNSDQYKVQLQGVQSQLAQQNQLLQAQAVAIQQVQQRLQSYYSLVGQNAMTMLKNANKTIAQLESEISTIESEQAASDFLGALGDVVNIFGGFAEMDEGGEEAKPSDFAIGKDDEGSGGDDDDFPKGLNDIISGGLSLIGGILNDAQGNPQIAALNTEIGAIQLAVTQIKELQQDFATLSQFYDIWDQNATLPQILPNLTIAIMEWTAVENYLNAVSNNLQTLDPTGNDLANFQDYMSTVQLLLQYIRSWYSDAQKKQDFEEKIVVLENIQSYLQNVFNEEQAELSQILTAESAQYLQHANQIYQTLTVLSQEVTQFNYVTLSNFQVQLPQNPSSADLSLVQVQLNDQITNYMNSAPPSSCIVYFTAYATDFPDAFDGFYKTNQITINIPFPNVTNYYNVHFTTAQVFMYEKGNPLQPNSNPAVDLYLYKEGQSTFLDQNFNYWTFNHEPIDIQYSYDALTDCALNQPFNSPDYIHYSPYGFWTITRPAGQVSKIMEYKPTQFTIEFEVYYYEKDSTQDTPMFGRSTVQDVCAPSNCKSSRFH